MNVIEKIRQKSKKDPKRIVLPEGEDERIVKAADFLRKEKISRPIVLTRDGLDAKKIDEYAEVFFKLRKSKITGIDEAHRMVSHPVFYAAMMTRTGDADGFVAGAANTTSLVARAAIQCIEPRKDMGIITSSFVMIMPEDKYGEGGVFVFADGGIIPLPTPEQLSKIAYLSAALCKKVLDAEPRVALLSYSSKGSAGGISVNKVREAVKITREKYPDLIVDGELQGDAAIIPEVARIKTKDSPIAGRANVLIFPNLDAGNICYKLVERLSGGRALGPLIMGSNKPCSDLSRGCSVDDVVDCVAITNIEA